MHEMDFRGNQAKLNFIIFGKRKTGEIKFKINRLDLLYNFVVEKMQDRPFNFRIPL